MGRADLERKRRAYGVQLDAFESERVREGLGVGGSASASVGVGMGVETVVGLESVVVGEGEDVGGLEAFFGEGEGEGESVVGGERGSVKLGRGRGRVEVRGRRVGIMADEDIDDEEGRKWY